MTSESTGPRSAKGSRSGLVVALCVAVAAGGFAFWLYGKRAVPGNSQSLASCEAAAKTSQRIAPLARGEVAALQIPSRPKPAVEVTFNSPDGKALKLADFRGKVVLLNLWATWCAPCRHEMPALDRLQKALGGADFEVVAVNIDTTRIERAGAFLAEVGVTALVNYADHSAVIFQDLKRAGKAFGMPTTLLIDRNGCEIGNLAGPAEWASDDALGLIKAAIADG